MGWFVLVKHEIDDVALCSNEDDLQRRVPRRGGEGPEQICVLWSVPFSSKYCCCHSSTAAVWASVLTNISCDVDNEVEGLRFERYAFGRLDFESVNCSLVVHGIRAYT